MKRAVFLDRDGVINEAIVKDGKPFPPRSLRDLRILPGVREALLRLRQNGFLNLVVTNQPDVARGKIAKETVDAIHQKLMGELSIDGCYTCWHDDKDNCDCRKPSPGLLLKAAKEHGIDLKKSFLVGDRWRDIEAGIAAGCKTAFIDYKYDEKTPSTYDFCVTSLKNASLCILNVTK